MTGTESELIDERYRLVTGKIREMTGEDAFGEPLLSFFKTVANFVLFLSDILERTLAEGTADLSEEELAAENARLYEDIVKENYKKSFANPDYMISQLGNAGMENAKLIGSYLSFLYTELRGLIPYAYDGRKEIFTIYLELFSEIYTLFRLSFLEGAAPDPEAVRDIIYWFESDNCDIIIPQNVRDKVDSSYDRITNIILNEDLDRTRFLYLSGEYVTDNEIRTAKYLATLPEDTIQLMADTFTEGYRIGFEKANKPLSKKKTVNIRYCLGFERVVRTAINNFEKMGLRPVIYRSSTLSLTGRLDRKIGFYGAIANRQYEYDHKDDCAIYYDADLVSRKISVLENAYEEVKELANTHAGPAVIEVFGHEPFTPAVSENAVKHTEKTRKLSVDYSARASLIVNRYIIGEERSFTIIAFPVPEIGKDFEKIFDDTVKLNTLPYKKYEEIQSCIIDALDKAEYVHVKGKDGNLSDICVSLHPLEDPKTQTKFENCVADVNIPVGEVFTSPVLKGTNGLLHVKGVFIAGLFFKDLKITFKDGMISEYTCANYDDEEANRRFVKDNILHGHDALPLGEFAIGTNTTAYRMGRDHDIEALLPVLIAEKTGPHFAVGDTCYSHEEDVKVYNPDGKEIIARQNEITEKRHENEKSSYFQCHTDITIPYDEIGIISAEGNESCPVIENGKFVLDGTAYLNKPLEGM